MTSLDQRPDSDVDILIDLPGLIELEQEQELSEDLDTNVDQVLKSMLKLSIGRSIRSEVVYL